MSAVANPSGDLTWDEFLAIPHETRNAALIDGKVVVNPPNAQHELIVHNLWTALREWARSGTDRGEFSTQQPVKIHDRQGYQPDFAWYPQDQCAPPGEPAAFSGLPSLIVEVLSPSTKSFDLMRKRVDYERIGIGEVWFVDPPNHVALACQRAEPGANFSDVELGHGDTLTSPLLPDFELPVSALFER